MCFLPHCFHPMTASTFEYTNLKNAQKFNQTNVALDQEIAKRITRN